MRGMKKSMSLLVASVVGLGVVTAVESPAFAARCVDCPPAGGGGGGGGTGGGTTPGRDPTPVASSHETVYESDRYDDPINGDSGNAPGRYLENGQEVNSQRVWLGVGRLVVPRCRRPERMGGKPRWKRLPAPWRQHR